MQTCGTDALNDPTVRVVWMNEWLTCQWARSMRRQVGHMFDDGFGMLCISLLRWQSLWTKLFVVDRSGTGDLTWMLTCRLTVSDWPLWRKKLILRVSSSQLWASAVLCVNTRAISFSFFWVNKSHFLNRITWIIRTGFWNATAAFEVNEMNENIRRNRLN